MTAHESDIDHVIGGLLDARQRMIYAYRTPAACIVCSRLAVEAFRLHDIPAQTVPVSVRAPSIGRQVGFEQGTAPRGVWNGHMVALVAERTVLDLTIDQLHGPHGPFPPHAFDVGPAFMRGQSATVDTAQGLLTYTAHPSDTTHRLQEDWTDDDERDRLIAHVQKKIGQRRSA